MSFGDILGLIAKTISSAMDTFTTLLVAVGANKVYMYMIVVVLAFSVVIVPLIGGRVTFGSDLAQRFGNKGRSDKSNQQRKGNYVDRRGTTDGTDRVSYTFGTGGK